MDETLIYSFKVHQKVDPTHTTVLRNAFARDMARRFKSLIRSIKIGVVDRDVFGLSSGANALGTFITQQVVIPDPGAFAFPRSSDKIAAFMRWLEAQVEAEMLTVGEFEQIGAAIESAWTNKYILESYKRGISRSRSEMKKSGFDIPSIAVSGGVDIVAGLPMHVDRLGVLYTRVFSELKGITSQMDQQISRILAQGIADGDNPRLLARKLVAAIDGTGAGKLGITDSLGRYIPAARRAELLARTEVIRAHHQGMVQEYMNWRVEGVTLQAEWKTAGDHRVCERCEIYEGETFTLEEAMNMIPLHPLCRCIALPYRKEWYA